ncbi:MAG: hypothetical protein ABII99_01275 [Patescibacteria group bacterium]|nr:hypothetical protein [Patescibacteria group bacterium]MBU1349799.1 hypothetical protein [Patescibacteria group bacterium]MBU1421491.1 hypothetical protein [Patescibacteria group bacterium]MBU1987234.1 hypothetical protein [Patescibacteria group bacterium]MBU2456964.1 hypothetical protein [Patescibacteria group bacterium]
MKIFRQENFNSNHNKIIEQIFIDQSYKKANLTLTNDIIDPDNFKNTYSSDEIEEDKKYVQEKEKLFIQQENPEKFNAKKIAVILEGILHEHSELSEWLGHNVFTIKTSRFDDIKNGIDMVAEFVEDEQSASHLGLAIDATFSSEIGKKFERIKQEIKQGKLAQIKYFQSDHTGVQKKLSKIPRIIIGADVKTIKELGKLWLNNKNKELGTHPIQFQILEEILIQLKAFEKYAQKYNQKEIAEIYQTTYKKIKEIYQNKQQSLNDDEVRDSMFYNIKYNVERL